MEISILLPELTASIRYIARFLKSEIPIYNSKVPDTVERRTRRRRRRRRTQEIAKRLAFCANGIIITIIPTNSVAKSLFPCFVLS